MSLLMRGSNINMDEKERIRAEAEKQDIDLLRLFAKRARLPFDPGVYFSRGHPILQRDSCLASYMQRVYIPMLRVLCKESGVYRPDGVMALDREIALKLMGRTVQTGEDIVRYKDPRGLPIYNGDVERDKTVARVEQVKREKLGLTDEQVAFVFNFVYGETKRIEDYVQVMEGGRINALGGIEKFTFGSKSRADAMAKSLGAEGKIAGVSERMGDGSQEYVVTVFSK